MRAAALALFGFALGVLVACGPRAEGADPSRLPRLVEPFTEATCILLRAIVGATVAEVCATAEELAPLVPEILARREGREPPAVRVAFAMPGPVRAVPDRRCVAWVTRREVDGGP